MKHLNDSRSKLVCEDDQKQKLINNNKKKDDHLRLDSKNIILNNFKNNEFNLKNKKSDKNKK